jgi:succinoglycan biosynthesis transport protein ExoP
MTPGMEKRKVDFTDVVFYVAIATKHARMMVLLISLALIAGLVYYVYARPVFYSRSIVKFVDLEPVSKDLEETQGRRFYANQILGQLSDSSHVIKRVYDRLGYKEVAGEPNKPMHKKISAAFNSEGNIRLDVWVYEPSWAEPFPQYLVEEFMADRREKAKELEKLVETRYSAEIRRIEEMIRTEATERYKLQKDYNPDQLKIEVEQLQAIPRKLFLVRQKLEQIERVRAKLHSSENLSVVERLTLYHSVDAGLQPGMIVPQIEPAAAAPAPGFGLNSGGDGDSAAVRRRRLLPTSDGAGLQGADRVNPGSRVVSRELLNESPVSWQELERDRFRLEQELREKSKVFLDKHPAMIELRRQMESVSKALDKALYDAAYLFELSYARLRDQEKSLVLQMPEYEGARDRLQKYEEARLLQGQGTDWAQRMQDAKNRIKEVVFAAQEDRIELQFIGHQLVRDLVPVTPNRIKLVVFSLALGFGLAIGIPFLIEFLDQTVTNMDKLEAETHMKGLGLVPDFEDTIAEAYPLLGSESMTDPDMLENFRVVRTNLVSSAATSKYPQVVMVTSTGPKEGKTVVSSNLALSFAQMGDKTLYIDTNLRRGLVHHLFSVRSSPGLSNVLVEKLDVTEAIRETAVENFSVLPAGDHLDGDIEMLGSQRMAQIMEQLRGKYQRIVLDAPPILGLSETAVMQPVVDGVVMVIWSAFTSTRQIRTAMDILNDNHANIYGFVLNRLDLSATMNRFHYYYYSNHYYNRYQSMTRVG